MDCDNKGLTGPIPAALGDLAQLTYINLHKNELTGTIPAALGALSLLEKLEMPSNKLKGKIPPALGKLTKLARFQLDRNKLTGPIPPALGKLTELAQLHLHGNQLTALPPTLPLGLRKVMLTNNKLASLPAAQTISSWSARRCCRRRCACWLPCCNLPHVVVVGHDGT